LLNGFYNPIDYPVNLKEIVLLREKSGGVYSVQSVPLNLYNVPPGSVFSSFTQGERNAVLNGDLIDKLWLNYSIRSCDSCNAAVQDKILGGTTGARVQKIEIEVLQPLTYAGANSIKLLVRSKQGDPNGDRDVLLPVVTIASDNTTVAGGELFVPDGESPAFEYQIVLIHADGSTAVSDWISSENLFVILGENTIKEHFEAPAPDPGTSEPVSDGN
jgi:hypothetical protein